MHYIRREYVDGEDFISMFDKLDDVKQAAARYKEYCTDEHTCRCVWYEAPDNLATDKLSSKDMTGKAAFLSVSPYHHDLLIQYDYLLVNNTLGEADTSNAATDASSVLH